MAKPSFVKKQLTYNRLETSGNQNNRSNGLEISTTLLSALRIPVKVCNSHLTDCSKPRLVTNLHWNTWNTHVHGIHLVSLDTNRVFKSNCPAQRQVLFPWGMPNHAPTSIRYGFKGQLPTIEMSSFIMFYHEPAMFMSISDNLCHSIGFTVLSFNITDYVWYAHGKIIIWYCRSE